MFRHTTTRNSCSRAFGAPGSAAVALFALALAACHSSSTSPSHGSDGQGGSGGATLGSGGSGTGGAAGSGGSAATANGGTAARGGNAGSAAGGSSGAASDGGMKTWSGNCGTNVSMCQQCCCDYFLACTGTCADEMQCMKFCLEANGHTDANVQKCEGQCGPGGALDAPAQSMWDCMVGPCNSSCAGW